GGVKPPASTCARPHQARKLAWRGEPETHDEAPQRGQRLEPMRDEAARRLQRKKLAEQRPVQEIDPERASQDIESSRPPLRLEHTVSARVAISPERHGNAIGERSGVAEAEIEPLRADRRQNVRGLADKRRAVGCERVGTEPSHGKFGARAKRRNRTEQTAKTRAELLLEASGVELHELRDL